MFLRAIIPIFFTCIGALTTYALYLGSQERNTQPKEDSIIYSATVSQVLTQSIPTEQNLEQKQTQISEQPSKEKAVPPKAGQDEVSKFIAKKVSKLEEAPKQTLQPKTNTNVAPPPEFVAPDGQFKPYDSANKTNAKVRKDYYAFMQSSLSKAKAESLALGKSDKKLIKEAFDHIKKKNYSKAWTLANKVVTPAGKKLIRWQCLIHDAEAFKIETLQKFWSANPDWADLDKLKKAAEVSLLTSPLPTRKKFFQTQTPVSSIGFISKASVLKAAGKKETALKIIRNIWHSKTLPQNIENRILKDYGKYLTAQDHRARADYFLYKGRSRFVANALRAAKHLDATERKKIDVRIAGLRKQKKTGRLIDALAPKEKLDPGVLFTRIQYARRRDRHQQAWDFFKLVDANKKEQIGSPDAWWKERRLHVREALDQKKYKTAYNIAKNHGDLSVNLLNEARFMSGWIALRYLKSPQKAYQHFVDLQQSADGPRSSSRAAYWLGRTALAKKQKQKARDYFTVGAKFFNTFYGQLSRQSLQPKEQQIYIGLPPKPSEEDIARFAKRDAIQAVLISHTLGFERTVKKLFGHLRYQITEPGELMMLAHLAKHLKRDQQVVRIGKLAMFRGINAAHYAYPIHAIPDFKPLRSLPEKAFYYAIARQESEFNPKIVSSAGARGLLQIMPITAKHVSQQHKIKYQLSKLLQAPSYNAMIGTAYIADRMDDFDGSYIKTIAGYNAGPGRVRQWIRRYGNPSNPKVNPIDWIERIPFFETRHYVKKVLANLQVYRSRLGKPVTALRIRKDLYRARRDAYVASKPLLATN